MAGVDLVVERGYIDEQNMFVYGCSGGGVLTSWVVGHTNRFAAASANCPVTNWLSFVGTTDGAQLVPQLREVPLGRPLRAPPPLPAHVRRRRHHAHHAHDRRRRPAHPDAPDRGVLPGAAGAEGPHRHDTLQERVARDQFDAVELPAHAHLPEGVVREAPEGRAGDVGFLGVAWSVSKSLSIGHFRRIIGSCGLMQFPVFLFIL